MFEPRPGRGLCPRSPCAVLQTSFTLLSLLEDFFFNIWRIFEFSDGGFFLFLRLTLTLDFGYVSWIFTNISYFWMKLGYINITIYSKIRPDKYYGLYVDTLTTNLEFDDIRIFLIKFPDKISEISKSSSCNLFTHLDQIRFF